MDLHEKIAKLAYELYEKSGRIEGRDRENWLEAERIIKSLQASAAKRKTKSIEQSGKIATRGKVTKKATKK